MKGYLIFLVISMFITACTVSLSNIDSVNIGGSQTDTVDEQQSPTNDVKPDLNLSIPVKPL